VTAQVKVRERGLGLLQPRLNASPVRDDSITEGRTCANAAKLDAILAVI